MTSLKQQAEALGISVDLRWSDATLKQKIADAKEAEESMDRDVSNPDVKRSLPVVEKVNTDDAREMSNIGQMRVETSQEIRERQDGEKAGVAPYPADPKEAHKIAAERAKDKGPIPEFDLTHLDVKKTEDLISTRLLFDWWDGQGNRHERGSVLDLPMNEARRLVGDGKAELSDPFRGK